MMMMFRSSVISLLFVAYNVPSTVAYQSVRGSLLLEQLEDPQLLTEFQSWAAYHGKEYDGQDEVAERLMIWKINNGECLFVSSVLSYGQTTLTMHGYRFSLYSYRTH
jgi:hypothetical protein